MELCRVCMESQTEMSQLFDSNSEDEFIIKIKFCTGVLFTKMDVLPSKICSKCLDDLHTAHKFKMKCLKSEQKCQDLLVVKMIKDEPGDDKDDVRCDDMNFNKICNDESAVKNDENSDDDVFNGRGDILKDNIGNGFDYEVNIKVEDIVLIDEGIGKAKKVRLKTKGKSSITNEEKLKTKTPIKMTKKRGPYNKTGKQARKLAKLKFRKLFCEGCNVKFTSKKESDAHKKEFHNEPRVWICEICGKSFAHRSSHHSHMRIHYPPQFACDHCDYKTANKHDLNKHLRIHSGNKSYICPTCAAAYRTSSNLHAHIRLTHERLRQHACTLCSRTFHDKTKLNRHMDSHNDVKRYSCEVCHSCFTRRCYWKKHLQKQHDIVIPSCRPGRPKASIVLAPSDNEVK